MANALGGHAIESNVNKLGAYKLAWILNYSFPITGSREVPENANENECPLCGLARISWTAGVGQEWTANLPGFRLRVHLIRADK